MGINMKSIMLGVAAAIAAGASFAGCSSEKAVEEKPKYLWFCAEANFNRFASQDSITYYLEKARATGFNHVVVDVKPIYGKVLYKSRLLPELTAVDSVEVVRDWDYLQYFIDEAHRLGMDVTASTCVFPAGSPWWHRGLVYSDSLYDGKTCVEYHSDGTTGDIRDNGRKVAAFLNPVREDVRSMALGVIKEIVENYDIQGFALDYCRYPDAESDFSADTRSAFEAYLGGPVADWPADVFTYASDGSRVPGKYYKEWWAFRAGVISDFIKSARDTIKAVNPGVALEYWAASWIHALHVSGQNWGSPTSDFSLRQPWGSEAYRQTGFAPYLDNFIVGTYLERVYGADDNESVEYGIARADSILAGDCNLIGSIYALNHDCNPDNPHNIDAAVSCCLENSGGVMVFDIVQIIDMDLWDGIKTAIDRYENNMKK